MANAIALSSAIRSNLLALQNTQSLTDSTQGHLATGQKVSSAIDNPVAYFQSKALTDRAADFQTNKDNIDQGISNLSTALQGITSIQTLVSQLKGLALSAQSATSAQIGGLVSQFNSLRTQIDTLAQDSSYQGLNLIAATGSTLTVGFSNLTGSNLTVSSVDATTDAAGLNISKAYTSNGSFQLGFQSVGSGTVAFGKTVEVVYSATASLTSGTYSFAYGTQNLSILVGSAGGFSQGGLTTTANYAPGTVYTLQVGSNDFSNYGLSAFNVTSGYGTGNLFESTSGNLFISVAANTGATVVTGSNFDISFTVDGLSGSTLLTGTYTFNYGGTTVNFVVGTGASSSGAFDNQTIYHNGDTLTLTLQQTAVGQFVAGVGTSTAAGYGYVSAAFTSTLVTVSGYSFAGNTSNIIYASLSGAGTTGGTNSGGSVNAVAGQSFMDSNLLGAVNKLTSALDTNLQKLRSYAQSLGTNVALLNTRLDFTSNYVNLLTAGSGKLTLADLNQEGANLLALQTRQQLGVQSLSFAGQNEKSILQLFR